MKTEHLKTGQLLNHRYDLNLYTMVYGVDDFTNCLLQNEQSTSHPTMNSAKTQNQEDLPNNNALGGETAPDADASVRM